MTTPNISLKIEPVPNGMVQFLKCAPAVAGAKETGHINVILTMTNNESFPVYVLRIEMSVPGSASGPKVLYEPPLLGMELPPGKSIGWVQPEDYIFELPASSSMTLKLYTTNAGDLVVTTQIAAHVSPTAVGSYRFWGAVRDLRAGEFWQVHGFGHAQAPAQLFGYDVGVGVEAGAGYEGRLPGGNGTRNEHYRIWGKPIYAIADGTVKHFRNDFPTNQTPGSIDPDIEKFWTSEGKDGNGNFFTIATRQRNGSLCPHAGGVSKSRTYVRRRAGAAG